MQRHRLLAVLTATALLALPAGAQTTAYVGATLWDGTGAPPVSDAVLVVSDGRIVSVGTGPAPQGAAVVDLSGRYVMPGLINTHGHVTGLWAPDDVTDPGARLEADLRLYARYGVTSVNSLGDEPPQAADVRRTQDRPQLDRARLHFAGPVITATSTVDAAAAVAANAALGVDWMKIRVDDNLGTTEKLPWPVVETVMEASHARGFRVATHLFYLEDAKRLLRMGSDLVAHSIRDAPVDAQVIGLLKERDVCYVPTLAREVSTFAYAEHPAFMDDPFFRRWADTRQVAKVSDPGYMRRMRESPSAARYRVALAQAQRNLKALEDAGVRVAMGTDSGPEARFPGYFEHMELQLMAQAGLTPEQILRSATGVAASCLGLDDVGTLEPGRWADFLVLDADPLTDVSNTETLRTAYVAGTEVR